MTKLINNDEVDKSKLNNDEVDKEKTLKEKQKNFYSEEEVTPFSKYISLEIIGILKLCCQSMMK